MIKTMVLLPLLLALPGTSTASPFLGLPNGVRGWPDDDVDCPCADPALCEPITQPRAQEDVYAFHTGGNASWRGYDWSQITTVCVFGAVDPLLLCKAHSVGARVTLGAGGPPTGRWNDTAAVAAWVREGVARVEAAKADGLNLDVEISADDPQQIAGLAPAVRQMVDAMHAAQPGSHVTFDAPSQGKTGGDQAQCGDMYGRDYDYKALAEVLDFIVVMDYDSNDAPGAVPATIRYEPQGGHQPTYRYGTREAAQAACADAGWPRLCRKDELEGFSHCAFGWTSDWNGYWMAAAAKGCGGAGYNPASGSHEGAAGAYCCGRAALPCPTCFFANAALPVVQNGVDCYGALGVPPSKLVLAMPWYAYDYTCAATDTAGGACHVTAAVQTSLIEAKAQLATAIAPGRVWQSNSSTPHFFYRGGGASQALHRVDYDDSQSLKLKYQLAKAAGARGVGMWTASAIAPDAEMVRTFWADLKTFSTR